MYFSIFGQNFSFAQKFMRAFFIHEFQKRKRPHRIRKNIKDAGEVRRHEEHEERDGDSHGDADFGERERGKESCGEKKQRRDEEHGDDVNNNAQADDHHEDGDQKGMLPAQHDEFGAAAHGSQDRFFVEYDKKF